MPVAEQRGGAEMMLLHLLRANQRGPQIEYHLAFLEDGPMVEEAKTLGYPSQVFRAGQIRQVSRQLQTVRSLVQWIKHSNLQVAMSWMAKAHLYAGPAAKLVGIPSVWWQHGIPDGHWIDRCATLLSANKIFCCSKAAENAQRGMTPHRKTCVIYPAVDLSRFDAVALPTPAEARAMLGLPGEGPLIGIVCRLQRWKGVHIFLEAAAKVHMEQPNAHFVVVGGKHALEPNYPDALAAQVRDLGMAAKVCFAGYQSNTALWMQAMNVFVHASISAEPFGMVVIEAMALGKTVIASKSGGPLEVIEDGIDGFLTAPGDPSALADAIQHVLSEQGQQPQLAQTARLKAASFSTDRLAEEVARNLQMVGL